MVRRYAPPTPKGVCIHGSPREERARECRLNIVSLEKLLASYDGPERSQFESWLEGYRAALAELEAERETTR